MCYVPEARKFSDLPMKMLVMGKILLMRKGTCKLFYVPLICS